MDTGDEKSLRNAVKNAKTAYYKKKGRTKKVFRKEARHNKRIEKKAKQHQFQLKKNGKEEIEEEKPTQDKKRKRKKRKRKAPKEGEANEEEELTYERNAYEAANKQDEQLIASLGKKLGLSKVKDLKKGFEQDGLDFLLEVCEPLTGGDADDGDNSDEEYLRAKKAKKIKLAKADKESKQQQHSSSEEIKDRLLFEDGMEDEGQEDKEGDIDEFDKELDKDFAGLEGKSDEEDDMSDEMDESEDEVNIEGEEDDDEEPFLDDTDDVDGDDDDDVDGDDDDDVSEDGEDSENEEKPKAKVKETLPSGKYIPPSLRKLETKGVDAEKVKTERLRKQLKGLLNRVSEPSLPGITSEIEMLYERNSRNTMNELLHGLVMDSCVAESLTPQRLVIQLMVIVAALHKTSQCEIGSYFLQMFVEKFAELHQLDNSDYDPGKQCANIIYLIVTMYNFKIVDSLLIYDIVRRLLKRFNEQDIELLLMILKACGTDMRKDDPGSLKDIILEIQAKSISSEIKDQSRVKFMLETINALKNNNMRKVPQYDPTLIEDGRKIYKAITKGRETMNSGSQLKVSLEDLLNAREKGKWWVIGSAWAGRGPVQNSVRDKMSDNKEIAVDASDILLEKAKKQRMNTGLRKNIFCILMTSEDYLDAFEKLQKLSLNEKQGREIIHVLLDCCLQEKTYNPFYAHLADHFCENSHSNKVTLQYSLWDRFKTLSTLPKHTKSNMANLLAHLIASKSLTLAVLKVVSFGVLDKPSIQFFTLFFTTLLLQYPENSIKLAFKKLSTVPKLSLLREGIKVFIRHFLAPRSGGKTESDVKDRKMTELIELVEASIDGHNYVPL